MELTLASNKFLCPIQGVVWLTKPFTIWDLGVWRTVCPNIAWSVYYIPMRKLCFVPQKSGEFGWWARGGGVLLGSCPLLWNSLPRDACLAPSLMVLWHNVKTQLFRWVFFLFSLMLPCPILRGFGFFTLCFNGRERKARFLKMWFYGFLNCLGMTHWVMKGRGEIEKIKKITLRRKKMFAKYTSFACKLVKQMARIIIS